MTPIPSPSIRPVALVTGASSGIGEAFARRLAADGYDLVIVARDEGRLESLAKELADDHNTASEVLVADLTADADVAKVESRLASGTTGASAPGVRAVDLLINNAGFGTGGLFHELPVGPEIGQIQLNVVALVRLTHAALGPMVARGAGSVINVSSVGGFQPSPMVATYSATKAFVLNFTEAIHEETLDKGVKVLCLCPGFTRTEFQQRAGLEAKAMPNMVWQSAPQVVDAALADLRRGKAVCVPGALNKATVSASHLLPRAAVRKIAKTAGKRLN